MAVAAISMFGKRMGSPRTITRWATGMASAMGISAPSMKGAPCMRTATAGAFT